MNSNWFVVDKDEEFGPFSGNQLKTMAMEGRLIRSSLVKNGLSGKILKAEVIKGLEWSFPRNEESKINIGNSAVAVLGASKTGKEVKKSKEVSKIEFEKESEYAKLSPMENIVVGTSFYAKKTAFLAKKALIDVKCKFAPDSQSLKDQSQKALKDLESLKKPDFRIVPLALTWLGVLFLFFYGIPSAFNIWSMASSERHVYMTNMLYRFYKISKADVAFKDIEQVNSSPQPRYGTPAFEEYMEKRDLAKENLKNVIENYRWFYAVSADKEFTNVRLEISNSGIRGQVDSSINGGKVTCYDRNGTKISKLSTFVDEDGEFFIYPSKDLLKLDRVVVTKSASKKGKSDYETDEDEEPDFSSLKKAAVKANAIRKKSKMD
jgi:hypothetical protein